NALRGQISNIQQASNKSIPEAWERLQEYIMACPHHGMDNWLILQNFYNGLTQSSRHHMNAAAGGAFFSLTIERATSLIKKMVSNQGWSDDRLQPCQRGMHSVKEADMLAMKIDLLLKKFEDYPQDKAQMQTLQALETRMTCEVCRNVGYSGDNCPETLEEALFLNGNNNGFRPQEGQGWNQPRPYYQGGNGNSNSFNPNQPTLTAKRRSRSPFRRSWPLQTNPWRPSMPRWTDSLQPSRTS